MNDYLGLKYKNIDYYNLEIREQILHKRLKTLLIENPSAKYFGIFGAFHVMKTKKDNEEYPSFTQRLLNDSLKVVSISCIYSYKPNNHKTIKPSKFIKSLSEKALLEETLSKKIREFIQDDENRFINLETEKKNQMFDFLIILNTPLYLMRIKD